MSTDTIVFQVMDGGQDGTDKSVIGFCSNKTLADRIALGRGPMGRGNGEVKPIPVWESTLDLPPEVLAFITKKEDEQKAQLIAQAKEKVVELGKLLQNIPEGERKAILDAIHPDMDDDIPF